MLVTSVNLSLKNQLGGSISAVSTQSGGPRALSLGLVQQALARGREAHPQIAAADVLLAPLLARQLSGEGPTGEAHLADLFLSCACAAGDPAALRELDLTISSGVRRWVARIDNSPSFADDVAQALRERLLIGSTEGGPQIAAYSGRGPLGGWLRVAAVRTALNQRTFSERTQAREAAAELSATPSGDPELDFLREQHRASLEEALREAVQSLPRDDRTLLRLNLLDGLSTERLAALLKVHKATAARRLLKVREAVLLATRRLLADRLRLNAREFDSLLGAVRSRLDLSLRDLFGTQPGRDG